MCHVATILSVKSAANLVTWLLVTDFSNFSFFFFLNVFPAECVTATRLSDGSHLGVDPHPADRALPPLYSPFHPRSHGILELRPEVHLPTAQPRSSPALLITLRAVPLLFYSCRPWVSLSSIIGTCLLLCLGVLPRFYLCPPVLWGSFFFNPPFLFSLSLPCLITLLREDLNRCCNDCSSEVTMRTIKAT